MYLCVVYIYTQHIYIFQNQSKLIQIYCIIVMHIISYYIQLCQIFFYNENILYEPYEIDSNIAFL